MQLYLQVYGAVYPLPLGSDRATMKRMLESAAVLWLVARREDGGGLVASAVFELDYSHKIGRLEGVVVDPAYRHRRLAGSMIRMGTTELLRPESGIHSIYACTRTSSLGPQLMCLRDGFLPLGVFLNAHRLEQYESVTLLAKYQPGVLERRSALPPVPQRLLPILNVVNSVLRTSPMIESLPDPVVSAEAPAAPPFEFETILAPHYVEALYLAHQQTFGGFYPFHNANLLLASSDGSVEMYACFSRPDRYCTILSLSQPWDSIKHRLGKLFNQLTDLGASYVETLVPFADTAAIQALLELQFLPSAVYPAMQEKDGVLYDMLIMSRTMHPLNFQGMAIDGAFKPYIDQYTALWRQMHLDTLKVFPS